MTGAHGNRTAGVAPGSPVGAYAAHQPARVTYRGSSTKTLMSLAVRVR
jgi:hypothetical protein